MVVRCGFTALVYFDLFGCSALLCAVSLAWLVLCCGLRMICCCDVFVVVFSFDSSIGFVLWCCSLF